MTIDFSRLRNTYYVLRHGQSEANVQGLIIGNPVVGCVQYGLTDEGRQQVEASVGISDLNAESIFVTSDFKRSRETATIASETVDASMPIIDKRLRERYFADLDGTSNQNYYQVWDVDVHDPDHTQWGVESMNSVIDRILACIADLEEQYKNETIVLVGHGDPLDALWQVAHGKSAGTHKETPLENAELRKLP